MSSNIHKLLIVVILFFFTSQVVNAQFANNKKKGKDLFYAIGAGVSGGEADGSSIYGGNLTFEARKPFWIFAQNYSMSVDVSMSLLLGSSEEKFAMLPVGFTMVSINAFSQSTKIRKNRFGGFLSLGMMIIPGAKKTHTDILTGETTTQSGMFGPAISMGPRFRVGKTYMDFRLYGGMTTSEVAYGGFNLMFTLGMKSKKRGGAMM